jgi:dihydrofolate reductase
VLGTAASEGMALTTLRYLEWQNSTLIKGDVGNEVEKLKGQSGGNIAVLGGSPVQTVIEQDLVDEYFLVVFPIVLGSGKRLFRQADQTRALRLVHSQPTTTGGVMLTYRPTRAKEL